MRKEKKKHAASYHHGTNDGDADVGNTCLFSGDNILVDCNHR